jgi:hypothetical protein
VFVLVMVILYILVFTGEAVSDYSRGHSFQMVYFCFRALFFNSFLLLRGFTLLSTFLQYNRYLSRPATLHPVTAVRNFTFVSFVISLTSNIRIHMKYGD